MLNLKPKAFIRPIGNYRYCWQLDKIQHYESGSQIIWKRWGMKDGKPFNDGHLKTGFILSDLYEAAPGIFRVPQYPDEPIEYFRLIDTTPTKNEQLQLF